MKDLIIKEAISRLKYIKIKSNIYIKNAHGYIIFRRHDRSDGLIKYILLGVYYNDF